MRVLRLNKEKMYLSITYDISWTKARNQIVKILESYGFRVQKSVFEIEITESQYLRIKKQLEIILNKADNYYISNNIENFDSIKFYILSKVWEWNLEWRIDGIWAWYEKIFFPDVMII